MERVERIEASLIDQPYSAQLVQTDATAGGPGQFITCVDNMVDGDEVFEALRRRLLSVQDTKLKEFGKSYPLTWLKALEKLEGIAKKRPRISLAEAKKTLRSSRASGREDEAELMLRLFANVGLLLFFNTEALKDLVVLQPQWLLDKMRNVLCRRNLIRLQQSHSQQQWAEQTGLAFTEEMRVALQEFYREGRLDADTLLPLLWPGVRLPAPEHAL